MSKRVMLIAAILISLLASTGPATTVQAAPPDDVIVASGGAETGSPTVAPTAVSKWSLTYAQVEGATQVKATFGDLTQLKTDGLTRVKLTAVMKYGKKTTRTKNCSKLLSEVTENAVTCDLADYGKWSVTARFYKGTTGSKWVHTNKAVTVKVVAKEYVIAPMSGTMPGTLLATSLWDKTTAQSVRGADLAIPVIARLGRAEQWNWSKLPTGVYALPYLTKSQYTKRARLNKVSDPAIKPIKAYIRDLNALGNKPTFHLYVNDYTAHLVHSLIYANKIPQERYDITYLSDGGYSTNRFVRTFTAQTFAGNREILDRWVKIWNDAKVKSYADGKVHITATDARTASYAAVFAEPTAEWWLATPSASMLQDQLMTPDAGGTKDNKVSFGYQVAMNTLEPAEGGSARTQTIRRGIKDRLNAITNPAQDNAEAPFKALYNFSEAYFSASRTSGKKIMVLLGTTVTGEVDAEFRAYARFTKKYYGTGYDYYYKGHPQTPTENYPAKQSQLKSLGLKDVQSSVPAELIAFFNPDIFMSGYKSSTWVSISDSMAAGGFGLKSNATEGASTKYSDIMEWFIYPKTSVDDTLTPGAGNLTGNYVVEVLDNDDYDLIMWDSSKQTITYYKLDGGTYTPVIP